MRLFTFTRMVNTVLLTAAVTALAAGVGAGAAQAAPIISHEATLIAGTSTAEVTVHSGASTSGKPMSVLILNDRGNLASPSRGDIVYLGEVRVGEGGTNALRVALPSATLDGFAIALNTGDGRYLAPLNPSGTLPCPGETPGQGGETPGTGGETPGTGGETPGTGGSEHPVGPGAGGNVQPGPGGGAASSSGSAKPGSAKPSQKTKPSQTSTLPSHPGADEGEGSTDGSSQDSPGEEMTPTPTAPATPQADDSTTSKSTDAATDDHQAAEIAWPWFAVGGILFAAIAALAYLLFVRRRSSTEN